MLRRRFLLSNVLKITEVRESFAQGKYDRSISKKVRENLLMVKNLLSPPKEEEENYLSKTLREFSVSPSKSAKQS